METTKTILTILNVLLSFWDWQYFFGLGYGAKSKLDGLFRTAMLGLAAFLFWKNFLAPMPLPRSSWLSFDGQLQVIIVLAGVAIHVWSLWEDHLIRKDVREIIKSNRR
ncbi:MAG: hypothetical protein R3D58_07115 [Saprospiraceae bacterium]|nr:hypothetical protein [Lewinellaceae bacterium]